MFIINWVIKFVGQINRDYWVDQVCGSDDPLAWVVAREQCSTSKIMDSILVNELCACVECVSVSVPLVLNKKKVCESDFN